MTSKPIRISISDSESGTNADEASSSGEGSAHSQPVFEIQSSEDEEEDHVNTPKTYGSSKLNQMTIKIPGNARFHIQPVFHTFGFSRVVKTSWKGRRYHCQLTINGAPIYHSKTTTRHPTEPIGVSEGTEHHFSSKSVEAYIHSDNKKLSFSLRHKEQYGTELMAMKFIPTKGRVPKGIEITMFVPNTNLRLELENRKPVYFEESGHWELNFDGKIADPSVKNCIIVKKGSDSPILYFRRVSKTNCEIDATPDITPLCIFAFAISSFVSPI